MGSFKLGIDQDIPDASAKKVFGFDKAIRFFVLLDGDGKVRAKINRPGVASLEPEGESEGIFARAAIAREMAASLNRHHGRVRTAIVVREKITLVSFMLSDGIVLISADPGFSLGRVEALGRLLDQINLS